MTDWDGTPIAETERLVLRTFRADDLPLYAALNSDPAVVATLGGPLTREESDEIAAWAHELFAEEGIGLLAIERREDGAFLGMCGLHHLDDFPDDVEIAWRLAHEHWGHGYATEAASSWLDRGFVGYPRVISITDRDNVRSLAVMARLGMQLDHIAHVRQDGIEFDAMVHSISAEAWAAQHQ